MSEEKKLILDEDLDEEIKEADHESDVPEDDKLDEAISKQFEKLRTQSMLLGAQAMCKTILDKIIIGLNKPGKISRRDLERTLTDIKNFCVTGLKNVVNEDGTTSPRVDENNNTKLKE